jgi:hypothetical protein
MAVTAQDVIDGAADLCNIKQVGEDLDADSYVDCRRRLNNLVKSLNNQKMISAFQAREVFPLVSDQGTYTIGPGGDFDTTRPFELEGAAILQNPTISTAYALVAASPSNGTFTVATDLTGVFTSGSEAVVAGGANDGNYTVVSSVFGANTVITVAETVPSSTVTTTTIQAFTSDNSTIEIPRTVYTDNAWQAIQVKSLTNSLSTGVYFNASYARGLAILQLWPIPNIATNALVLYRRNMLATFADLATTSYAVPPGFEELLEYNLAKRMLTPYAIKDENVRADVMRGAAESMAICKRTNAVNQMNDMPIDPAYTHDRRGYYNIQTSNG